MTPRELQIVFMVLLSGWVLLVAYQTLNLLVHSSKCWGNHVTVELMLHLIKVAYIATVFVPEPYCYVTLAIGTSTFFVLLNLPREDWK